jgi:cytochrome bd-type quinol oxidase subunit 2
MWLFMNCKSRPKRILVAIGVCLSLLIVVLVMVLGHLTVWVDRDQAAEKATTSNLIYSGAAAAVVAALLVVLFIAMRTGKGDGGEEEPADGSEEEFEEA